MKGQGNGTVTWKGDYGGVRSGGKIQIHSLETVELKLFKNIFFFLSEKEVGELGGKDLIMLPVVVLWR